MSNEAKDAATEAMEAADALDALAGVQRVRPGAYVQNLGEAAGESLGELIAKALGVTSAAGKTALAGVANAGVQMLARAGLEKMGAGLGTDGELLLCRTCKAALGKDGIDGHRCAASALPGTPLGNVLGKIK